MPSVEMRHIVDRENTPPPSLTVRRVAHEAPDLFRLKRSAAPS